MDIRPATPQDFGTLLGLNEASVAVLSPLTPERLQLLHEQAALHWVVECSGQVAAFLLAFREGSPYNSTNYQWFAQRYQQFLYIDRIVVSSQQRGQGIGSALYNKIIDYAQTSGIPLLTCEIDIEPPNEGSQRFHQKLGFQTVGSQATADGKKQVALQALKIQRS